MTEPEVRYGVGGEGGHWYAPDPPRCAYEIKGANGKWRPVTLRDARKYGFFPGVTTILREAASPGLERWKVRQGIMAALTHPKAHEITDMDELLKVLEADSKAEAKAAAQRGSEIHAAVEDFFMGGKVSEEYEPFVEGVIECLKDLTGINDPDLWSPEETVTHEMGVGTRIDLWSQSLGWVLDLKTKDFGPDDKVAGYPDHCRQLAVGRKIVFPEANCANIFISRNNPGLVRAVVWEDPDLAKGYAEFKCLLKFWQTRTGIHG